ncbi:MAG TPA: hypothetical protein VN920_17505 [Pyrinomonadaceae bacterium]|nr:hypothetical protein [Pyrinomonadaceae bacterium]
MSAQSEVWRVSTVEGIFVADLDTLKQWIVEGCVLPTDKVSKGTLSWIEAGRAPMLRGAFNGEGGATVAVATTDASTQQSKTQLPWSEPAAEYSAVVDPVEVVGPAPADFSAAATAANTCHNHAEAQAKYICRVCAGTFCEECPRFIGASKIPLCPLCGDLCRLIGQEREKLEREEFRSTAFGFADFNRAFRYPWQHKMALLFGAALYGFLLLAGFRGRIIAFVIMFGCIAQVINQVAYGRLDRSFLPDLSAFSLWDDLICPLGLGIAITIVTWGPAIVIVLVFVFGVVNSSGVATIDANQQQSERLSPEEMQTLTDPNADPEKLAAANRKLGQSHPGYQTNPEVASSTERHVNKTADVKVIMNFLRMGLVLLPFFLLSVVWAIFYYPMALTVAGYTEQFRSVINPLVGLDTIPSNERNLFQSFRDGDPDPDRGFCNCRHRRHHSLAVRHAVCWQSARNVCGWLTKLLLQSGGRLYPWAFSAQVRRSPGDQC